MASSLTPLNHGVLFLAAAAFVMKAPAREVAASHHSIASACEYGTAEEELSEEQRNEMREKV